MSTLDEMVRAIVRDELASAPDQASALERTETIAVSVNEAGRLVGYSGSFLRAAISRHELLPSYANSKAVIEVEELKRWVRSLSHEPPSQRRHSHA